MLRHSWIRLCATCVDTPAGSKINESAVKTDVARLLIMRERLKRNSSVCLYTYICACHSLEPMCLVAMDVWAMKHDSSLNSLPRLMVYSYNQDKKTILHVPYTFPPLPGPVLKFISGPSTPHMQHPVISQSVREWWGATRHGADHQTTAPPSAVPSRVLHSWCSCLRGQLSQRAAGMATERAWAKAALNDSRTLTP